MNIIKAYDHIEDIRELFHEYTNWIGRDLSFQGYYEELSSLPGKYAEPDGRLLVGIADDQKAAGCVALRKIDDTSCEMKRLYVRPLYRGQSIGQSLMESIVTAAAEMGYREIFLDTLSYMEQAIKLYKKAGFLEIDAYYDNPMPDAVYFKKSLE